MEVGVEVEVEDDEKEFLPVLLSPTVVVSPSSSSVPSESLGSGGRSSWFLTLAGDKFNCLMRSPCVSICSAPVRNCCTFLKLLGLPLTREIPNLLPHISQVRRSALFGTVHSGQGLEVKSPIVRLA